ncbi:hypothetical protein ASC75_14465 [Aminobacter sp. DSM 101952]|nr:hypothetical protein ASC75_14465 [Aminobacter sp. DSM 101952]
MLFSFEARAWAASRIFGGRNQPAQGPAIIAAFPGPSARRKHRRRVAVSGNVFEILPNFPSLAASNGWAKTSLSQQPDIRLTPMQQLGNIA